MNKQNYGIFSSASIKTKIVLGFLFSIIPMLAIVAITYFPATDNAIQTSHRQISLISSNGVEHLELFMSSKAATFADWTEEDIYGMALEFDAIDELESHFMVLQRDNPEFELLLLTDNDGLIRGEGRSLRVKDNETTNLVGRVVSDLEVLKKNPTAQFFLVPRSPIDLEENGTKKFLYCFNTTDSSGNQNGYFLAYLNTASLKDIAASIYSELNQSGYSSGIVGVFEINSEQAVAISGSVKADDLSSFIFPIQTIVRRAVEGDITRFTSGGRTDHTVYHQISLSDKYFGARASTASESQVGLFISVDENDLMVQVRSILALSSVIAGIGLLSIVLLGFFTSRAITKPITNLVEVLQHYSKGNTDIRAAVTSGDEIGFFTDEFNSMLERVNSSGKALQESEAQFRELFDGLRSAVNNKNYSFRFVPNSTNDDLAISLNNMLETLESASLRTEDEDWLKTGLTTLSEKISGEQQLDELCKKAITFIANYTGVQVGTLFVSEHEAKEQEVVFKLIASYAYRHRKELANSYSKGEGMIGQAALEKKILHFSGIPDDYIRIESSLGQTSPQNIIIIPLIYEGDVKGIIELGASFTFSPRIFTFAEQVSSIVAVAINAAIANRQLTLLLDQTRNQSETLKEQQEDLQNANQELEEQTEILKESEARLQLQQEELQTSNEEMEEKNQLLEEQKRENEEKNRHLEAKQQEIEEKARQLELATKYKSEFLSNMSHELRTPLNSILLLAKMLSENEEDNLTDDQIDSAASIHRGGQTLLHLINDILDLSKIEAGKVELNISSVSPEAIIANFEQEFKHLAKDKGLDLKTEIENGVPGIMITDVHRLEQIIRNLLGNALKFTETGSVTLNISRPVTTASLSRNELSTQNSVQISITDTGPGIHPDKLDQIFEAFRQVDGSISRRHGGTGLGLSISRELAYLLGGEITVQSAPYKGTTFAIFIPEKLDSTVIPEQESITPTREPVSVIEVSKPPGTVLTQDEQLAPPVEHTGDEDALTARKMLIIEDDPEFSLILTNFFQKSGYESITAPTGELGVKFAIDIKPTAIILDIGLPGIDGWAVLSELKNNPDTRHIPVHIMSAYDDSFEGLKKGAVGYLTKPVSIEGLRSALGKIEHVLKSTVKELLVVEDDIELRNNIMKLMGTQDVSATSAETGKDALELIKTNRFDCMILDLGLPDISGFTLLDEIEKDNSIGRLPVIIYTGRDLTMDETERLQKYSSSIVLKSAYSMERLLDETALFMHRVEQEMPENHKKMIEEVREKNSSIKGKDVLLVDDDMRNAFALSKFLKQKGVNVTIADNGQKALDLLETSAVPDIILMDIMMPVMDGYEAMKAIRAKKEFKDLPILALTAKAMDSDREECLRCGANDYLSKPIDTKKLLSMMRIWMY